MVVHCKNDPFDIYIGRPSKWGNPYSHKEGTLAEFKTETRKEAIEKYRDYILSSDLDLEELRGKILGCWCKPKLCHGDVIIELLKTKPIF